MKPADRRAVILAAATEIFAKNSYEQASMRTVASAAGITTPVLYDHFAAKGTLHAEVLAVQREALAQFWSQRARPKNDRKAFRAAIMSLFEWIEHNPYGWQVLDTAEDFPVENVLAQLLLSLPYRELDDTVDEDRLARVVAASAEAVVRVVASWWQRSSDIGREVAAGLAADLLWQGLAPTEKKKKKK